MVREYLKSVLHEIEEQRKANTAEIEEQRLEKETIDKKIARIQSKKEFDMEYFSPRRSEGSLREQLADLQKNNKNFESWKKRSSSWKKNRKISGKCWKKWKSWRERQKSKMFHMKHCRSENKNDVLQKDVSRET